MKKDCSHGYRIRSSSVCLHPPPPCHHPVLRPPCAVPVSEDSPTVLSLTTTLYPKFCDNQFQLHPRSNHIRHRVCVQIVVKWNNDLQIPQGNRILGECPFEWNTASLCVVKRVRVLDSHHFRFVRRKVVIPILNVFVRIKGDSVYGDT